jgi:hypothetical protein
VKPLHKRIDEALRYVGTPQDDTPQRTYAKILKVLHLEKGNYESVWDRRITAKKFYSMRDSRERLCDDIEIIQALYNQHLGLPSKPRPEFRKNVPSTPYGE